MPRERLIATAQRVYRSYGFCPIDTPALEYEEILLGKGSGETDKQLYRFEDSGGRRVALRFDLTVPLARFVAQHINELGTPFKRYHIAPVWRGENTQRGRYREFMQCDFDTIGSLSAASDIETVLVINDLLTAIGFQEFTIHVNNRMVLGGMLERLGLAEHSAPVLVALDKLHKIGPEMVAEEIQSAAGATAEQARAVLRLADLSGDNDAMLRQLESQVAGSEMGELGVARLAELIGAVRRGRSARRAAAARRGDRSGPRLLHRRGVRDVSHGPARDRQYLFRRPLRQFGGTVHEAKVAGGRGEPGPGSAAGGHGRIGDATQERHAGRDFHSLLRRGPLARLSAAGGPRRAAGYGVEVYPEPKKLGQQLKYADRRGFKAALVAGENEFAAGTIQIKNLATAESRSVPLTPDASELLMALAELLGSGER